MAVLADLDRARLNGQVRELLFGRYPSATMSMFPDDRRDLAAMFAPLTRALIAREEPVLHAHDISMWGYIVLTALAEQPVRTQAALAQAINADKSRIISVLGDLQERGLIQRQPDAADRRGHLLSVTPAGDKLRQSVQAAIRVREDEVLAALAPADREAFLRSLKALYELYGRHERLGTAVPGSPRR